MENALTFGLSRRFRAGLRHCRLEGYTVGVAMALTAGLLWSTAGIGIRLIEAAGGWQIVFYRAAGLMLMLSLVMLFRSRGRIDKSLRESGLLGVLCGVCVCLSFIANVYAVLHTSVANVVLILSTTPFLAALLGWLFLKERVGRHTWRAMALSLVGVLFMVGTSLTKGGSLGVLFALAMAVTYAGYTVLTRRGRERDMLPAFWVAGLLAMLIAAPQVDGYGVAPRDLSICLLLGAGQAGLGLTLFTLAARHVPAAELPLLAMAEVILAPVWVWVGVGEVPGAWTLVGGAVILAGIVLQARGTIHRSRSTPAQPLLSPAAA